MRGPIIQEIPRQYPGKPQGLFMFYPTVGPTFFGRDSEGTAWALTPRWAFENARRTGTQTCSRIEAGRITHSGDERTHNATAMDLTHLALCPEYVRVGQQPAMAIPRAGASIENLSPRLGQ